MRVLLDANVQLAGFCFDGLCRYVTEVCLDGHALIVSEPLLDEVQRHLISKFRHTVGQAVERCQLLRESAATYLSTTALPTVASDACRDPDDLFVLATAMGGRADCLVTGDHDLLEVARYGQTDIVSPRQFWERLRSIDAS